VIVKFTIKKLANNISLLFFDENNNETFLLVIFGGIFVVGNIRWRLWWNRKNKKTNKNFISNLTCQQCQTELQMKISLANLNQLKSNSSPPFSSSIFYIYIYIYIKQQLILIYFLANLVTLITNSAIDVDLNLSVVSASFSWFQFLWTFTTPSKQTYLFLIHFCFRLIYWLFSL